MSHYKGHSRNDYSGARRQHTQYINAPQQRLPVGEYPSPQHDYYGGHAMTQNGSSSSHSSFGSGHWNTQASANASYGLLSPAASPQACYFSNSAQLEDIELDFAPPVPSHKPSGSKRSPKSPSPSPPSSFTCLVPQCGYSSLRAYDLKRHMNSHSKIEEYPCKYSWCGRDVKPFSRHDHLTEHVRKVHMKDVPKKGGRKARKEEEAGA